VAVLGKGEMFGETAMVYNRPRNATMRAKTALDVVAMNREAFHELLGNLPGLSTNIETIMSARLGRSVGLDKEVAAAMSEKFKM